MRLLPLLALVVIAVVACGDDEDPPHSIEDDLNALSIVKIERGEDFTDLPQLGQPYECVIDVAIQAPAGQQPFRPVNATCQWTVDYDGEFWFATFRETWRCDDFSADAPGFPDCVPPTGSHEWVYKVDLKGTGDAEEISSTGQFAPDMTGR